MPTELMSTRGNSRQRTSSVVASPARISKANAPETEGLSRRAWMRVAAVSSSAAWIQNRVKRGTSSPSGLAVERASPRAEEPKAPPR